MILSNAFDPDVRVQKEARTLVKNGWRVTVIAWDRIGEKSKRERVDNLVVKRYGPRSGYNKPAANILMMPIFWLISFADLLRREFDVVHCHDFDTLIPGFLAAKIRRKKVIYDAHEFYPFAVLQKLPRSIRTVFELFEALLVRRVDTVIIVDELQRLKYEQRNARVATVSNFPELSDFKGGIKAAGHVLVYVGGLTEDRGILECIEAARLVRNEFKDTRLMLLGPILDKKLDQRLRAMANNEKYKGLFTLFGKLSHKEVIDVLGNADVGMLLLRPIGQYAKVHYPVKLFEYMASSLPVVVNSGCAYAEVVLETGCGVLAKNGDVQDIAAKIAYLFENPEGARNLGRNGRKAVELRYNWVAESRKLISSYGALAAK